MQNEEEIFKTYALKRLSEENPMFSDFPSTASESLTYLSKETGISVLPANETYLKTETDQFGEKQKYRVENIDEDAVIKKRAQNIENIIVAFSPDVAKKIKKFEDQTKYLHTPGLISKENLAANLKESVSLFSGKDKLSAQIRIIINKKIHDLTGKKLTLQQQKNIEKKENSKIIFYNTLKEIHKPYTNEEKIVLYKTLLKHIKAQDYDDIENFGETYSFMTEARKNKFIKSQKSHIRTELKRDIAEQIYNLYRADFRLEAGWWKQELDAYQEACDHYKERVLGPKNAFAKGGVYGPDSRFSGLVPQNIVQNNESVRSPVQPKDQKREEIVTELSLFSDKDFEY